MSDIELPSNWLRGVLEPLLLSFLSTGEAYGYQLAGQLEEHGLGRIPGGSLYPALVRLEKQSLLTAEWRAGDGGPGRKYYSITSEGRAELERHERAWNHFASAVSSVLTSDVCR